MIDSLYLHTSNCSKVLKRQVDKIIVILVV